MGRRNRARLERWARRSIDRHGPAVAELMGVDGPLPQVTLRVAPGGGAPGSTSGLRITLSEAWFRAHPDDEGCVIHELSHAYLCAPVYDATNAWLIEGIADHIRDRLGMEMPWTFAHFEVGKAAAGYQTTAHFLAWLEEGRPGVVQDLSRRLADGTYDEGTFAEICERPLSRLISAYETEMGRR
ncbi:MAG: basic secretory protein-like protein [Actinomycetota bacterium]